ncbi:MULTISPECIES: SDR family NAD(P)-dependent oxidoreductase [unclassified Microbacterium]|uniref:SDR family NAD(P)-dependent oxidoreductase n=1 Tax=unclassified Microbacterium TaxID=2609290 RepID=UPI00386F7659
MTRTHTLLVGCGKVATSLGRTLLEGGGAVTGIRRDPADLPEAFGRIAVDLSAPLSEQLPRVDAMVITLTPGESMTFLSDALGHLRRALPALPERTVYVSSTRVFEAADDGRRLDETSAPAPGGDRARALLEGERRAAELFGAVILRPAGIYGPGRERLIRQVRTGTPVDYDRRTNRIHEDDLVRALRALLDHPEPPSVLHGVDGHPATLGDVVQFIAEQLGVAPPPRADVAAGERRGTVLDGARLGELLGDLDYPSFREGYGRMIDDLR